ncbi:concanavalin A-like lectin/glucanase domain-containing protein [Xylaria sp. CBS 124048]|nr:concanavalin A-like lectin/glucanase domain-containing protein [Xylaria sp. CBS 124048]
MPSPKTLLAVLVSLAGLAEAVRSLKGATAARSSPSCTCYKATASSPEYFLNRQFFDFRNIANPVITAPITAGAAVDMEAVHTNSYFSTSEWTDTWSIQNWNTEGEGVYRQNSANNILIASANNDTSAAGGNTYLTLRTQRQNGYQSTAEVESIAKDYLYLTTRMYARTVGSPGAVTSLFTYASDTQEADLEIRTSTDAKVVQYTNQPGLTDQGEIDPAATSIVNLTSPWTDWHEYRYDWTPGSSEWFVDGKLVASIHHNAPAQPLSVIMNVWSDGGEWSGVMPVGASAEMQVQWLDLTYNSSSQPAVAGPCSNACVVDDLLN